MKTSKIKQTVIFKASPAEIYNLLMDSKKHSAFTDDTAKISSQVGEKFTAYGDYIEGKNLELIKDKKIVQTWHALDWPAKHFSTVTFNLNPLGKGTKLIFTQTGIPEGEKENISDGWKEYYWEKMKEFIKNN